jgi:hypothetical protein
MCEFVNKQLRSGIYITVSCKPVHGCLAACAPHALMALMAPWPCCSWSGALCQPSVNIVGSAAGTRLLLDGLQHWPLQCSAPTNNVLVASATCTEKVQVSLSLEPSGRCSKLVRGAIAIKTVDARYGTESCCQRMGESFQYWARRAPVPASHPWVNGLSACLLQGHFWGALAGLALLSGLALLLAGAHRLAFAANRLRCI